MEGSEQGRGSIGWWQQFGLGELLKTMARAVEPSKIVLALGGFLAVALWGYLLDRVWLAFDSGVVRNGIVLELLGIAPEEPPPPVVDESEDATDASRATQPTPPGIPKQGIFAAFWEYETRCIWNVIESVRRGRFIGSMDTDDSVHFGAISSLNSLERAMSPLGLARPDAEMAGDMFFGQPRGVLTNFLLMIKGEWWLVKNHWVFALLLFPFALVVKCIVGGAICRISALQIGQDMHVSLSDAFSYSVARVNRWLGAILLPFLFMAFIGALLYVGGVLMSIPWLGDVVGGLFFPIALLGGLAIAIVSAGVLLGGGYLWPVIAVEGEDPFNSVSRSFEFVFQRPVKTVLYWFVLLILGCVSFVAARFFVWFSLAATHTVLGAGTNLVTNRGPDGGLSKLDTLWSLPKLEVFFARPADVVLGSFESLSSWLIALWVLMFGALVWAYLYSFFFTGATTAMMLVRRDLWGNSLADVEIDAMTGPYGTAEVTSNKENATAPAESKGD